MKTNWIKTVNEINHKRFTIPLGWETRDQVAESLQCAPDKVADILKPGIASGDIEKQDFPIWDEKRRLSVKVTCFRLADRDAPAALLTVSIDDIPAEKVTRIIATIGRNPGLSDRDIATKLFKTTSREIAAVRAAH
jgi:hypothetical protein